MNSKKFFLLIFSVLFFLADAQVFSGVAQASDISSIQSKMEKLQKQQQKTQAQLQNSQVALQKNVVQVNTTKTVLQQVEEDIARKQSELDDLNQRASFSKTMLVGYLQEAYVSDQNSLTDFVMASKDISETSENFDQMMGIKDRIVTTLDDIDQTSQEIQKTQSDLSDKRAQHEKLLAQQKAQQGGIISDINEAKATLAELQQKFAELQSDLNRLLGSNYNAKDIEDAVKFASDKTGVPVGFLVGVLKMETNLGANVGGCTYSQVESGAMANYKKGKLGKTAWATFQVRRNTFKGICSSLDIDYGKQKVSCNPSGYAGTGGAMGVAQFMPDTWNGYKSGVSSITGHNPPSPWNLTDGVVAMALKLKRTPGVTSGKTSALKSAACSYLGTCYAPYIKGIIYWADNYKTLLD